MPTTQKDLPGTLKRSPAKARRTYAETLESAEQSDDSTERAHRAARSAVKHSSEKVGDHREAEDELYERAKKAGVKGRSSRSRSEPADAIARRQG